MSIVCSENANLNFRILRVWIESMNPSDIHFSLDSNESKNNIKMCERRTSDKGTVSVGTVSLQARERRGGRGFVVAVSVVIIGWVVSGSVEDRADSSSSGG